MRKLTVVLFLLVLVIGISAKFGDKEENSIVFNYALSSSNDGEDWLHLDGKIKNNRPHTVYFMSESCNGMVDYLVMDTSKVRAESIFFCEISELVKKKIKTGEVYLFTAELNPKQNDFKCQIDLKFVERFKDEPLKTTILKGQLIQSN